jgi:hypothetical protein
MASMPEEIMRRRTVEERYQYNIRKQQRTLEEFAEYGFEWSEYLMMWYKYRKEEMPDDVYRAYAFFQNREYRNKAGSLTLLYQMYLRCNKELPSVTKENAFDILSFRYKMFAKVLETGGYT